MHARTIGAALALLLVSGTVGIGVAGDIHIEIPSDSGDAVPDDGPDYGVNNSTFQRLWSEDIDNGNLSADDFNGANVSSRAEFAHRLAQSTDIPFARPPQAASNWNSGDFGDYNPGGQDTSVYPAGASLEDGVYIKDAYASIFAVQPSTILHQTNGTTKYVPPEGQVRALSDYRVAVPEGDQTGPHRERWSIDRTSIESMELSADGRTIDTGSGHQTTLQYTNLSGSPQLIVETNITVTLRHVTLDCPAWNSTRSSCGGDWNRVVETVEASKTVSASQTVVVNQLSGISGNRVQFEAREDQVGAVVHPNTEWSTITVDGDVRARSNWWFYTAGRSGWQTMLTSTATNTSRTESSVRPVQVHAFPSQQAPYVPTEPTDNGKRPLVIEETWGTKQSGPSLPANIDLESANPYVNADSIALSSTTLDESAFREVTVQGIVREQSRTVSLSEQQTVRETNLTLSVTEANATHAVVRATVTENETDDAVTTGRVTIGNQTTALNSSGMAVTTVSYPAIAVRGQYTSAAWWRTDQPYSASEDVAKTPANFPDLKSLIQLVVVTMLWFIPVAVLVFGFDYMSGGELLGLTKRT
ncbi:hypothetical protein [Halobacterium sp. CBA1126]|uniref:hypothetical protein n=1 Tax=Halobacterium sp. CBA1126 TaxID=2668074 RepID=UPI0012FC7CA6|nr:hypothetical protein [Halobacterium sp. CBA1126]MUV59370.1 hypothetical protein [Halobacterium sp. CBA1126]